MTEYYKANPCSRKDLRELALRLRSMFGLENELYFPIVQVYELLANQDVFNFEVLPISEMGLKYGETFPKENLIHIREDIYDGACENEPFARSTMGHELLHFLRHDDISVSLCRAEGEIVHRKTYEDPEWQANCFSGELFVPYHLTNDISESEVIENCKVTECMANYQLNQYQKERKSYIENRKRKNT